jgi:uncharacterized membrane protein
MASIFQSVTINAERGAVFDLISRVEEFPLYAHALREVEQIGRRTYRWVANVRGLRLAWDSKITEFRRPERIAWRSIKGFENAGAYTLRKVAGGTRVELQIDYRFPGGPLGRLMEGLVAPVTRRAAAAILARVRGRLEQPSATATATAAHLGAKGDGGMPASGHRRQYADRAEYSRSAHSPPPRQRL